MVVDPEKSPAATLSRGGRFPGRLLFRRFFRRESLIADLRQVSVSRRHRRVVVASRAGLAGCPPRDEPSRRPVFPPVLIPSGP
jgi:hypothetical protein